jgi:tripartite-type tricarboxylate transporter receptor subunit TctC
VVRRGRAGRHAGRVVGKLSTAIKAIVAQPDVQERFYSQGIVPVYAAPEEFADIIRANVAKYARVIKTLGLKPE